MFVIFFLRLKIINLVLEVEVEKRNLRSVAHFSSELTKSSKILCALRGLVVCMCILKSSANKICCMESEIFFVMPSIASRKSWTLRTVSWGTPFCSVRGLERWLSIRTWI